MLMYLTISVCAVHRHWRVCTSIDSRELKNDPSPFLVTRPDPSPYLVLWAIYPISSRTHPLSSWMWSTDPFTLSSLGPGPVVHSSSLVQDLVQWSIYPISSRTWSSDPFTLSRPGPGPMIHSPCVVQDLVPWSIHPVSSRTWSSDPFTLSRPVIHLPSLVQDLVEWSSRLPSFDCDVCVQGHIVLLRYK